MDTLLITHPYSISMNINSIDVVSNNHGRGTGMSFDTNITINFNSSSNTQFMSLIHVEYYTKFNMYHRDTMFTGCLIKGIGYNTNGDVDVEIVPDYYNISEETPPEILALQREKTIDQLFDVD
tara:strand:+ start:11718 stop:12086 length:369 start_codon:yes stop_codon:yes gene_type:complete